MKAFATVGTTRFDDLVHNLMSDEATQKALVSIGVTHLVLQTGNSDLPTNNIKLKELEVTTFDFDVSLTRHVSNADLVISHAGAGSCLEALYANKPLIVVINSSLMNDHQTELADKLESEKHIVKCNISNLSKTIQEFDEERRGRLVNFEPGRPQLLTEYINNIFVEEKEVKEETSPNKKTTSDLASKSVLGAGLNVLSAVLMRATSFVVNAFVLRIVAPEALGLINVRLPLLFTTILFLSREAFRKACLQAPPRHLWPARINLLWICLPVSIVLSFCLGWVWLYLLDCPLDLVNQYRPAVWLTCLSVILNVVVEPFYIVGQTQLWLAFFSFVELMATWVHLALFLSLIFVFNMHDEPVLASAYAFVMAAIIYDLVVVFYFCRRKKQLPSSFVSLTSFLPRVKAGLDVQSLGLTWGFFKQGFVKQMLTEGEQYVFTWWRLMSLSEQSVYNIVANLGAIPARLVFAKVEETAYVYFSQTIKREEKIDQAQSIIINRQLHNLLKASVLLGLIACAFGFSYSHLLLSLYGGSTLASMGTQLLRAECFYLFFMAVNGISECYAFCIMSQKEIERHNYFMSGLTVVFLTLAYVLSKMMGPVGFVAANCCNFAMRIAYNFKLIQKRHKDDPEQPTNQVWPSKITALALVISAFVCQLSEMYIYSDDIGSIMTHLVIGAICGIITVVILFYQEHYVREFVLGLWKNGKRD